MGKNNRDSLKTKGPKKKQWQMRKTDVTHKSGATRKSKGPHAKARLHTQKQEDTCITKGTHKTKWTHATPEGHTQKQWVRGKKGTRTTAMKYMYNQAH